MNPLISVYQRLLLTWNEKINLIGPEARLEPGSAPDGEDGHEDDGAIGDGRQRPPPEITHQRPKRRSRLAYEASALSRSVTEKSGQSTSVAHISA